MTNLDSTFKSRDISLPIKAHLVKAVVFPVVIYGCESWTIKKAECRRTDAFELWYWRRLLRVPWTARRSNQFILKEISTENSLEGLMLKLKLQYLPHAKSWLIRKDSDAWRDWGQEEKGMTGWDSWMTSPAGWAWIWVTCGSWWGTGRPGVLRFMGSQRVRHDWATELYWTFHCIYVPQLLYPFICHWASRLLPCPIVNSAMMSTGVHVSFSTMVSSGYMPSSGIIGSYGGFTLSFLRNFHPVLHSVYQFTFPPTVQEGSLFSTLSPAFIVYRFFWQWPF